LVNNSNSGILGIACNIHAREIILGGNVYNFNKKNVKLEDSMLDYS
jgi:hypothetical protein